MKRSKSIIRHDKERGFTIIEAVVSLLIVSVISLGATMANAQLINQTSRNESYLTAERQVLNALHWITTDIQMSQTIQPAGTPGFPLTLEWTQWDNSQYQVIYTLVDNEIKRFVSVDGSSPSVTLVASYINSNTDMTYCTFDNGLLTIKLTSSIVKGGKTIEVSKVEKITSRPNL